MGVEEVEKVEEVEEVVGFLKVASNQKARS
jgi:hypothetical protein